MMAHSLVNFSLFRGYISVNVVDASSDFGNLKVTRYNSVPPDDLKNAKRSRVCIFNLNQSPLKVLDI